MTREEAVKKVQKLFALASDRGATEHEAANAAAHAQRLMLRFGIEQREVENRVEAGPDVETVAEFKTNRKPVWKATLFSNVAWAFGCRGVCQHNGYWENEGVYQRGKNKGKLRVTFVTTSYTFELIGREHERAVARLTYEYLVGAVERIGKQALKERQAEGGYGALYNPKTWASSWRFGCVSSLSKRLREQRQAQERQGLAAEAGEGGAVTALVVTDYFKKRAKENQLLYSKMYKKEENVVEKMAPSRAGRSLSGDGYQTGWRDGDKISLNKQIGER